MLSISRFWLLATFIISAAFLGIIGSDIGYSLEDRLLTFEDKILGIKFQYPDSWDPLKISQTSNINLIEFTRPLYANSTPYSFLEPRYTDAQIKVEDLFPEKVSLDQYMKDTFASARFLSDFTLSELSKTETLGGIPAYKLLYNYTDRSFGDNEPIVSYNKFAIKDYVAYLISVKTPTEMSNQYVPRVEKIANSFTLAG